MITIKEKAEVRKYMNYYRKLGIKVYINTSIAKIKKEFKKKREFILLFYIMSARCCPNLFAIASIA